jgi:hypothetical protein
MAVECSFVDWQRGWRLDVSRDYQTRRTILTVRDMREHDMMVVVVELSESDAHCLGTHLTQPWPPQEDVHATA